MHDQLAEELESLPREPGVYLFFDRKGDVIYVGKARNLRARVRSYFQAGRSDERFFIGLLDAVLGHIETVVTSSEKEAFLLENSLIKKHQPRYNIRLRDDKDFLHLRLDLAAEWPRLELVRRPKLGGKSLLFGPYHSARSARKTMLLASKFFRLRTCKDSALKSRTRPCLLYQLARCPGPCVLEVSREEYLDNARHAGLFLAGKHKELAGELRDKMKDAAAELAFERAALHRDQLRAVEATLTDQNVVELADVDQDVFGLSREGDEVLIIVLLVRDGRVQDRREHFFPGQEFPDPELLASFVTQFYKPGFPMPKEVILPMGIEDPETLGSLLSDRGGKAIKVWIPKRGRRAALIRLAQANAVQALGARRSSRASGQALIERLAARLKLAVVPTTIECLDVAHMGKGGAVAALSAATDGVVDSTKSRSYKVRSVKAGDDYGAMYEVVSRRLRRAKAAEPGWEAPDLLVLDGGRGQLSVATAAAHDVGLKGQQIIALAKERQARAPASVPSEEADASVDRVYLPGRVNPIAVRGSSPLQLLCQLRDEAHRLAGKLLASQQKKKNIGSKLEDIPGVGPKVRTTLLKELGSLKGVQQASLDELASIKGVGPKLAEAIHHHLRSAS